MSKKLAEYYDVTDAAGRSCMANADTTLQKALVEAKVADGKGWNRCYIMSHKKPHKVAVYTFDRYEEYAPPKARKAAK